MEINENRLFSRFNATDAHSRTQPTGLIEFFSGVNLIKSICLSHQNNTALIELSIHYVMINPTLIKLVAASKGGVANIPIPSDIVSISMQMQI